MLVKAPLSPMLLKRQQRTNNPMMSPRQNSDTNGSMSDPTMVDAMAADGSAMSEFRRPANPPSRMNIQVNLVNIGASQFCQLDILSKTKKAKIIRRLDVMPNVSKLNVAAPFIPPNLTWTVKVSLGFDLTADIFSCLLLGLNFKQSKLRGINYRKWHICKFCKCLIKVKMPSYLELCLELS